MAGIPKVKITFDADFDELKRGVKVRPMKFKVSDLESETSAKKRLPRSLSLAQRRQHTQENF